MKQWKWHLGFAAALLLALPASAATITVTSDADAGAGTLRQALADAADGDTIVFDGDKTITTASTVSCVDPNVTIDGEDNTIIIQGADSPDTEWNPGYTAGDFHGFQFTADADNCTLRNVTIKKFNYGLLVNGCDGTLIEGVTCTRNNVAGIHIYNGATNITVKDGVFAWNRQPGINITSSGTSGILLEGNEVYNNTCNPDPESENYLAYDSTGQFAGIQLWHIGVSDVTMRNNSVYNHGWYNILWDKVPGVQMYGNKIGLKPDGSVPAQDTFVWCSQAVWTGNQAKDDVDSNTLMAGGFLPGEPNFVMTTHRRAALWFGNVDTDNATSQPPLGNMVVRGNVFWNIDYIDPFTGEPYNDGENDYDGRGRVLWQWAADSPEGAPGYYLTGRPVDAPTGLAWDGANVTGVAAPNSEVDVFADPFLQGERPQCRNYIGTAMADGSGNFTLNIPDLPTLFPGMYITAMCTADTTGSKAIDFTSKVAAVEDTFQVPGTPLDDTDMDGVPDWFEDATGMDKDNFMDAWDDPDEDDAYSAWEYVNMSNPNDAASTPDNPGDFMAVPAASAYGLLALLSVLALGGAAFAVRRFA